ncbi:MAG TPA: glycosyltransferase [Pirellulales bacterium]|nr:glycosyltransferase [Pirellulales bacterium]
MKLALVHDWLTGMRGGEKCLEVLCRRFPDAELFTLLHRPGRTSPAIDRMRITTSFLQRIPAIARHYRYWLPVMPRAAESLRIPDDVDLVVSFSHAVAKSVRAPRGVPHVCYCFTPMRYAWQLRGEYFDGGGKRRRPWSLVRDALLDRIRDWDRATSDRVTHFVAISETIAGRIRDCYGRDSTVIYPPVDTDFYTPGQERRDDYYLCVSALVPYKKIDLAVRACRQIGRELVVIGAGPERRKLAKLGGAGIEWLGWRSNEEIREHLRRCRALLFPGQEDFGIVPLESQACGTPVIAYGRGGATETVLPADEQRSGSGVFFDEPTPAALADAMRWLEGHPARFSGRAARRQALRFNAERYESEMLAYLEWVMEGGRTRARRAA